LLLAELCRLQLVKEALNATGEPYDLAIRTHRTLDDCVYVRKQVYRLDQAVLDSANVSYPNPKPLLCTTTPCLNTFKFESQKLFKSVDVDGSGHLDEYELLNVVAVRYSPNAPFLRNRLTRFVLCGSICFVNSVVRSKMTNSQR